MPICGKNLLPSLMTSYTVGFFPIKTITTTKIAIITVVVVVIIILKIYVILYALFVKITCDCALFICVIFPCIMYTLFYSVTHGSISEEDTAFHYSYVSEVLKLLTRW